MVLFGTLWYLAKFSPMAAVALLYTLIISKLSLTHLFGFEGNPISLGICAYHVNQLDKGGDDALVNVQRVTE